MKTQMNNQTEKFMKHMKLSFADAFPELTPEEEPFRVVALGDSVTKGVRPGVKDDETFEARLEELLRDDFPKVRILNEGIGSNSVTHAWTRIFSSVVEKLPAFCTIMFGINDSYFDEGKSKPRISKEEFENRLRTFVRFLRCHAIEPVLLTANPMTSTVAASKLEPYVSQPKGMNFMLEQYNDITRKVAKEEQTPLIEIYRAFREAGVNEDGIDKLLTDGMHPNPKGHKIIAGKLACYFKKAMPVRSKAALPRARGVENQKKALERLSELKPWKTVFSYKAKVLPDLSTPPWVLSPAENIPHMAKLENGALRLSTAEEKKPLTMTMSLPVIKDTIDVTFKVRVSRDSEESPCLSIANGHTRIWIWIETKQLIVSRHDRSKDRIAVPVDATAYHKYRIVMIDMDLHLFIDDNLVITAPVWLVPSIEGNYVQISVCNEEKPVDTRWKLIEIRSQE